MDTAPVPELMFVYNADGTLKAAAGDFATRLFAPENYSCNLCMVTYGPLTMRTPWKEFLDTLPNKKTFLHRDEFRARYPESFALPLPAVLIVSSDGKAFTVLLDADAINQANSWQELKTMLVSALNNDARA